MGFPGADHTVGSSDVNPVRRLFAKCYHVTGGLLKEQLGGLLCNSDLQGFGKGPGKVAPQTLEDCLNE